MDTFIFVLFCTATLTQLALWRGVFYRLTRYKSSDINDDPPKSCSIIICARNEAANLRLHLPFILDQQWEGEWELIVVDDASTDDTSAVLQAFSTTHPERLRVLHLSEKQHPGKKQALAAGIQAATHPVLLFTDADCRPASPHWLAHMMRSMRPGADIVLGYAPLAGNGFGHWAAYETACTGIQYLSLALAGMPYMGVGRNLAIRKRVWTAAGGFERHAHLASGDDDLLVNAVATAKNTSICIDNEAFVHSAAPAGLAAWMAQKKRHLSAGTLYKPGHQVILGAITLSLVCHYGLALILLLLGAFSWAVMAAYALRLITVMLIQGQMLRKFGHNRLIPIIPVLDGLMALYYGAVVPVFLWGKRQVTWKN